jgi:hypothetical protein
VIPNRKPIDTAKLRELHRRLGDAEILHISNHDRFSYAMMTAAPTLLKVFEAAVAYYQALKDEDAECVEEHNALFDAVAEALGEERNPATRAP